MGKANNAFDILHSTFFILHFRKCLPGLDSHQHGRPAKRERCPAVRRPGKMAREAEARKTTMVLSIANLA